MAIVSVYEAKTHLSRLINQVLAGDEIVVRRGKEAVIKLIPLVPVATVPRRPGRLAHLAPAGGVLNHGFWDALPDAEFALWNGQGD